MSRPEPADAPRDPSATPAYENPQVDHRVNVSETSTLREFFSLSLWLAAGVLLLVAGLYFGFRWLAPSVPFEWERRLADPIVARWFEAPALPAGAPEDRAQRLRQQRREWLQHLAEQLRPGLGMPPDMPITVHWRDSAEPNAFATLGGHVFIHQGLLDHVESENAVAMVMAHEMAHVKHRDPIVATSASLAVSLALQALTGGAGGGIAGETAAALSQLNFSRRQERAADAAALDAVLALYGHTGDAEAFFSQMLCMGGANEPPEFLHSHPDTRARVAAIRAHPSRATTAEPPTRPLPAFMHSQKKAVRCMSDRE